MRRYAAAVSTSASATVTDNLADISAEALAPHAIDAISVDDCIADMIVPEPSKSIRVLRRMRDRFENPALDVPACIHKSEAQGLLQVATPLRWPPSSSRSKSSITVNYVSVAFALLLNPLAH